MMMKTTNLLLLAAIVVFMFNACNTEPRPAIDASTLTADSLPPQHPDSNLKDPMDTASSHITRLVLNNRAGYLMEMAMGTIAQQNAQSSRVKNFGAMMLKDYTKANSKLLILSKTNHIIVPAKMPARIQSHVQEISKYNGKEFDRRYMLLMAAQHQKDIDLLEKTARTLRDTTFKDYIIKTLSLKRLHLDSANTIKNQL